jgi:carbon storage regulator
MTLRWRRDAVITKPLSRSETMLVLTRKIGETVRVSTDIVVTVLEVNGSRIRLGFDAPPQVAILRGELCGLVGKPSEDMERRFEEIWNADGNT